MNISSYGKSQLSLASALLPVQTMPMCALDIESQEICQVMFRDALVDFSPSPNGEMVDQSNQIQLQQTRSQGRRQAKSQLKSLQQGCKMGRKSNCVSCEIAISLSKSNCDCEKLRKIVISHFELENHPKTGIFQWVDLMKIIIRYPRFQQILFLV